MHEMQTALFDFAPFGTEPPVSQRLITPGCLLPLQHKDVVDINRAKAIFGTSQEVVRRLRRLGHISGYQLSPSMRWYIEYNSIVEFCDRLRISYNIRDRRPKLRTGHRWRDADLLPFPLADTVSISEVMIGLEVDRHLALNLLEEGVFENYRLAFDGNWRISKTSLFAYRERLRAQVTAGMSLRKIIIRRNV